MRASAAAFSLGVGRPRVVHAVVRAERLGRVVEVGAVLAVVVEVGELEGDLRVALRARPSARSSGTASSPREYSAAMIAGHQRVGAEHRGRRPPAAGCGPRSRAACRGRPCASSTVPRNGQSLAVEAVGHVGAQRRLEADRLGRADIEHPTPPGRSRRRARAGRPARERASRRSRRGTCRTSSRGS